MKVFELNGVGAVTLVKSRRARKLNISLESTKEIRVTIPHYISFRIAEATLSSNVKWVQRYLTKMKRVAESHNVYLEGKRAISREEAISKLTARLKSLAVQLGFTYNKVSFRYQKTVWGSCSRIGNISLNVKLASLPDDLVDYVIVHELLHTQIRNHGKSFWKELNQLLGNARELDARLKKYCPALL